MRGSEERAELGMAFGAKEEGWGRQHPRVSFQGIIKGQLRKSLRSDTGVLVGEGLSESGRRSRVRTADDSLLTGTL